MARKPLKKYLIEFIERNGLNEHHNVDLKRLTINELQEMIDASSRQRQKVETKRVPLNQTPTDILYERVLREQGLQAPLRPAPIGYKTINTFNNRDILPLEDIDSHNFGFDNIVVENQNILITYTVTYIIFRDNNSLNDYLDIGSLPGVTSYLNFASNLMNIQYATGEVAFEVITYRTPAKKFIETIKKSIEKLKDAAYTKDAAILLPITYDYNFRGIQALKRTLKQENFQLENTIDHSVNKPAGRCVIDILIDKLHHIQKDHIIYELSLIHPQITNDQGYTIEDIDKLFYKYPIKGFIVYDSASYNRKKVNNKPIFENYNYTKNTNKSKLPDTLVVFSFDNHIYEYPISTANNHKATDIINRPGIKDFDFKSYEIIDNISETEKAVQFIDSPTNIIHTYAMEQFKNKVIPMIVNYDYMTSKVTQLSINNTLTIYAPLAKDVMQVINNHNATQEHKIIYNGQPAHLAAYQIIKAMNGMKESMMSPDVYRIYRHQINQIYPPIGWVNHEAKSKKVIYLDVKRHYTAAAYSVCVPIIQLGEEFMAYDESMPILPQNQYFVYAPQSYDSAGCFCGDGIYPGQVVSIGLCYGFIKFNDIQLVLNVKNFYYPENHIRHIENEFSVEGSKIETKQVINALIGYTKTTQNWNISSSICCRTWEEVLQFNSNNSTADHKLDTIELSEIPKNKSTRKYSELEGHVVFIASAGQKKERSTNDLPFHHCINAYANALLAVQIMKLTNNNFKPYVLGYSTDSIAILPEGLKNKPKRKEDCEFGEIGVYDGKFRFDNLLKPRHVEFHYDTLYEQAFTELTEEDKQYMDQYDYIEFEKRFGRDYNWGRNLKELTIPQSVCITGMAGSGKSYVVGNLVRWCIANQKKFCILTPTHESASNISDVVGVPNIEIATIHAKLGFLDGSRKIDKTVDGKGISGYEYVFVDECFAVDPFMLDRLRRLVKGQIILSGDPEQTKPINGIPLTPTCSLITSICKAQYLNLTKIHRTDDPVLLEEQINIRNGLPIRVHLFGHDQQDLTICYTNERRKQININKIIEKLANIPADKIFETNTYWKYNFISMPIMAFKSADKYKNKARFNILNFADKTVTLIDKYGQEIVITKTVYQRDFQPLFSMTVHCAQGRTFDFPISIDEWYHSKLPAGWLYVAISRNKKISQIHLLPQLAETNDDEYPADYERDEPNFYIDE